MFRPIMKQPFTTLTPSTQIFKRAFTIKSQPSPHTPIIPTNSSRTLTLKRHHPAIFSSTRVSNHAFTRTFKVYSLYPQLPVATTTALAYFSFPKGKSISNATSYYAALPLSPKFSYQDLECEVRDALRESCRLAMRRRGSGEKGENNAEDVVEAGDMKGEKEEEMGKLKFDITVVWQGVNIGNVGSVSGKDEGVAEMSISGMDKEKLAGVLRLMAMRGWKDIFCVRVGAEEGRMKEQKEKRKL
ncbi:uncharacterized protein EAE98_002796 [Botrytis deweyae]|uniref:Uncharacterized protein n=1 Tax=Botrytis deweyae TaxID=2478750 RepID=A0ABQ7IV33_9HELO|nr:uncharacterized protein EAE98_002796 [Botrytis deweyae]KAF7934751.1 hypothetical protein EAE98_002796 [Botrytis deweyae]